MNNAHTDDPPWGPADLEIKRVGRRFHVRWPERDVSVVATKPRRPSHSSLVRLNPHLHFSELYGSFHEFFIEGVSEAASFRVGKADVGIGEISPIGMFLFEPYYDRKEHGDEWGYLSTVQIANVAAASAEVYLLNALRVYGDHALDFPAVISFDRAKWWDEPTPKRIPSRVSFVTHDLEPLRFLYYGRREADHAAACVQFYRVLEFYAFFKLEGTVSALRHDQRLPDRDFLKRIASALSRDERTSITRFIESLATPRFLRAAVRAGLVTHPDERLFSAAAYDFRNAIVHAKYDYRSSIESQPVLQAAPHIGEWRRAFEQLARAAIDLASTRETQRKRPPNASLRPTRGPSPERARNGVAE
jgi:hypothetical protein